ncbi:homeobox-leucine zipper protein ROC8-like [Triticum urartu]|uniref:homeobox-leucine zipper protein ROC8-like n=1 Tax=Triticum urartu TaxID=4572 RepID=UPI0020448B03|nr:homeobox-leucine zipper protein ROC8-like [Triticum urartu]
MDFGDHQQGGSDSQQQLQERRKRQRRHAQEQVQKLEESYKKYDHPNEIECAQLGRELGLETKQIEHERLENRFLRWENTSLRSEIMAVREALKNSATCPHCVLKDCIDQQELNRENARLKAGLLHCTTSFQQGWTSERANGLGSELAPARPDSARPES